MQLKNKIAFLQFGVGLIEVLVALFILAVGLLGVLAMQANGIKGNQRAEFSTEAYILAQDIVDRIQAYNDIDSAADDDDYDQDATVLSLSDGTLPNKPACVDEVTGCNANDQVAADLNEWGTSVGQRLPSGEAKLDYIDTAGVERYVVTIMWDANQDGSNGTDCNGAANQLTCYSLEFKL